MSLVKVIGLLFVSAFAWSGAPEFVSRSCPAAAEKAGARCGVVQVPEDPLRSGGRLIDLNVFVLPATGRSAARHSAQLDLEGGPGFAATDFLAFYAGDGAMYREHRDIVLADMRGTGASHPLRCPALEELGAKDAAAPIYPAPLVADCAAQLSKVADLRQYTTANAARDLEAIRRALGYEQWDINAISYGTTLALHYIDEFPERVRTATLTGTVPMSKTPPRYHAVNADAAFVRLAAECAADVGCRSRFGDPDANLRRARAQAVETRAMPDAVLLEALRTRMYLPATRAGIPALLSRASAGDFHGLAEPGEGGRVFADGVYLSITCAESFAAFDVDAAIEAAKATLFGAYRLERQRDACAQWPVGDLGPRPRTRRSTVPVLFIAGELDPVSPPEWAKEESRRFSRGRVVVVRHGAHVMDGLSGLDTCLDAAVLGFIESADARRLDATCFDSMVLPPSGDVP